MQETQIQPNSKLFIGMDLHKNSSTFCVKDGEGKLIASPKVLTDKNEVSRFITSLKKHSNHISLALEPVSKWYYYADLTETMKVDVRLAHPMKVKAIASARIKTDKIDASVLALADLLQSNLLPEAYFSPSKVRSWKERCRYRASLIHLRAQIKNKIHAILFKHSLRHNFSNLFGRQGRGWLASLKLNEPFQSSLENYLTLIDSLGILIKQADKSIQETVNSHLQGGAFCIYETITNSCGCPVYFSL